MKKTVLALLGGLALAATLAAIAQEAKPAPTPAGPKITIEPASFDFGVALPGKTLHKEFVIRNLGAADLVIEGVSTTCGCTAALTESRTVKPGASTPLRVSLETRSYSGVVQRAVLVRSNDAGKPSLEVKLQVNVQPAAAPAAK